MPEESRQRDLRIDFFRGLAQFIVLIDHIEGWAGRSFFEAWMLIHLGFSDAAEIFVFLSGYVFASAYSRTLAREGLAGCMKKAIKRSLDIYFAYLMASVAVIAIGAIFFAYQPPDYQGRFYVGDHAYESIVSAAMLRFHPWGFDILTMYVVILPEMALLLSLLWRGGASTGLAWLISGGVYLAVQFYPALNFTRFGDRLPWYFNPFAWQFLFFIGMYLGNPARQRRALAPAWKWLFVALSIAVLAWGVIVVKVLDYPLWIRGTHDEQWPLIGFYRAMGAKTELAPLRLVHFFALAYLASVCFPPTLAFWSKRAASPVIVVGQNSLEVYAFGLVLTFVGVFLLQRGPVQNPWAVVAVDLVAWGCATAFAYYNSGRKRRKPAVRTPPPAG